jgi:ketosteroid isomerase-like protein
MQNGPFPNHAFAWVFEARYSLPVSSDNVELVRSIYAAWLAGTSARGFIDPEIEYVNPPDAVESGTRRGPGSFGLIRDAYDDVEVRPERFVETGDDVVVVATLTGVSREARIPVKRQQGYVWTVKDGKAVRFRWFNSAREALNAAGIEDE